VARFLSLLPHAGGNVAPTLLIVRELLARGHEVVVLGPSTLVSEIEAAGASFRSLTHARPWDPRQGDPVAGDMLNWLRLATDRGLAEDFAASIEQERPDGLLVDCMVPVAFKTARRSRVPTAVFLHTLRPYWEAQWSTREPMGLWLRMRGASPLAPRRLPDAFILGTAPELDPPGRYRIPAERLTQVGPVIPAPSPSRRGADLVVVSVSTIAYPGQRHLLCRLIRAVGALGVRAVVTSGAVDPTMLPALPGVEVVRYADHGALLASARLLVCHGGHGSTMRGLAAGVPVLVLPLNSHADHALIAAAVERLGVGRVVDRHSDEQAIADSVGRALVDQAMRTRAEQLGHRLRARSGAERAADCLEQLQRAVTPVRQWRP
jgi:UDP:flavonoid glycosyltransferase YjiC (YdhE family)